MTPRRRGADYKLTNAWTQPLEPDTPLGATARWFPTPLQSPESASRARRAI